MTISSDRGRLTMVATLFLLLILVVLPVGAQSGWGEVIDTFETSQALIKADSGTTTAYSVADGTGILGGERDLEVGWESGSNAVTLQVQNSRLSHSQESLTTGYSFMSWDGNDNDATALATTGLGGIDLTDNSTADRFYILVVRCDWGTTLTIDVYTDSNNWARGSVTVPASTNNTMFQLPFSSVENQQGSVTWTNVGAITMYLNGEEEDLDVTIDLFGTGGPTAVDLLSFTAGPASANILLAWETGGETGLQGFNLHRSDTADGTYTQINTAVIQAQHHGQPIGGSYTWRDTDVVGGNAYYYKLEALEDGSISSLFGPASARALHVVYLPLVLRH